MRRRSVSERAGQALRPTEGKILFWGSLLVYQVVAAILMFGYESSVGDAQSRMANGFYVLFSRDPHLAAVGFVWNPLPSWADMPLLLLKPIFPFMTNHVYAALIVSSLAMAGSVVEILRILRELGVRSSLRRTLVVLFALQPMIVYYAANGMSEALEIYLLLLCARYLARWYRTGGSLPLVAAGVSLAVVYLCRNEGAFAAATAAIAVALCAFFRVSTAGWRDRVVQALTDATVFIAPFVFVFVGWAAVSWLIVGHPFEYLTSQYGNSSQLVASGVTKYYHGWERDRLAVVAVLSLAPVAPIALVAALWRTWKRRDPSLLAPLTLLGGVLAFTFVATVLGQTFGWYRIYITVIPISILCLGVALDTRRRQPAPAGMLDPPARRGARRFVPTVTCLAVVLSVLVVLPSYGTTAWAIATPKIGREDHQHLGWVFNRRSNEQDQYKLPQVRFISRYLDGLHARSGSILVDTFVPCVPYFYVTVRHPKMFVITNDRDFQPILADPVTFKINYLLVDDPSTGIGALDALNQAYPRLFNDGAGIATLVQEWAAAGTCPHLRLYKLNSAGPT